MSLRWSPRIELSKTERLIIKRCAKRKLFVFLRQHRRELFDEELQAKLATAYGERRRGEEPVPPAQLAMAALLQAAFNVPDHDVPEMAVMERRWQMVLDCAGADEPPFTQATVYRFRQRMMKHGLDKVLFDKTVALAKKTGAFSGAKLRAAFDACPLYGAGRVEDTFNLIGRAAFHVVRTAAQRLGKSVEEIALAAGIPIVAASSIKAGLDIDWDHSDARSEGLRLLLAQVDCLHAWLNAQLSAELLEPPLCEEVAMLEALIEQDTEPDPDAGGHRIKDGVAKDRVISLGDRQMRHGRKSKRQRIDGYKRHIAVDVDSPQFIIGVAVTPANRPERDAAKELLEEVEGRGAVIGELQIDRGYLGDKHIEERRQAGMDVVGKPFPLHNHGLFTKADFDIDLAKKSVTCPNDVVVPLRLGSVLHFPDATCAACAKRAACTRAKHTGRSLSIHDNEDFLLELRAARRTPEGRQRARARIHVEHGLARLVTRSGTRAKYRGLRKNLFDQRRHAAVVNLRALASLDLTGSAL
jgi:Transposase DDE domain/Transposase domain (DUF772)